MSFSDIFARLVALVGAGAIAWRRLQGGGAHAPAVGSNPAIPTARPQGSIPTLKMPTARGWARGQTPVAAPGLKVNAFAATGLKHPRWIHVLPNGDVTVAEALFLPGGITSIFDYAMVSTMKRAAAIGVSPNRITLLRDADGDGVAEIQERFLEGLKQPFGMALLGDTFYVVQHRRRGGLSLRHRCHAHHGAGAAAERAEARRPLDTEPVAEPGWAKALHRRRVAQQYRRGRHGTRGGPAAIHELDLTSGRSRIFAGGLRNPVGLAIEPNTGVLWTVVNERDGLGDETPPDYLTAVRDGGFYGWPYCYWGQTVDDRVPQDPAKVATAITPDYALGGHTASLGLCWLPAGTLPGFPDGMAIGQHGSWNRSTLSGYKVVFVPFENGAPPGRRATSSRDFWHRTSASPTGGRSGWRSDPTAAPSWWRTTWAT